MGTATKKLNGAESAKAKPAVGAARPRSAVDTKGLGLTPDQLRKAADYKGPINHGSDEFALKR